MHYIKVEHTGTEPNFDLSDIRVFQEAYNDNYRQLKYFGLQYLPDEEIIADLIQDIWLKIWERKGQYAGEAAFKRYLMSSLYNAILNHVRHDKVKQEYAERKQLSEATEQEISHKIIEAEIYDAVNRVFDELPDACRRVYAASLEGKSQKEIAEQFCISVNTVKKHINNANHYMRKQMKRFLMLLLSFS